MKVKNILSCIVSIFFMLVSIDLFSQDIQFPMDNESRIQSINADMEKKLGLFSDYSGFIEARIFKAGVSEYSLEIMYRQNGPPEDPSGSGSAPSLPVPA